MRCSRENPIGAGFFNVVGGVIVGVKPFDPGLATNGPQLLSVTRGQNTLTLLDKVGTFFAPDTPEGQLEIRGAAAARRPGAVDAGLRRLRRARVQFALAAGPEHVGAVSPRRLGADARGR